MKTEGALEVRTAGLRNRITLIELGGAERVMRTYDTSRFRWIMALIHSDCIT